jgi:hypothetical protein
MTKELFQAGVDARRAQGDYNEYDLVLAGLGAVLRASDLATTADSWEQGLSRWFHWPLSASGMLDKGLEGIVEEMIRTLKNRNQPHKIERVLRGRPRWVFNRSVADNKLEEYIVELEKAMAGGGDQRIDIANTRGWGRGLLRRIVVIEALGGDVSDLAQLRKDAQEAIEAADRMAERCHQRIEDLKRRMGNLPVKRARALKPLSELSTTVRKGWRDTATPEGSELICDGCVVLRADALYANRRRDLYARTNGTEPAYQEKAHEAAQRFWQEVQETDGKPIAALGWRSNWLSRDDDDLLAYAIMDDDAMHFIDPHRAACIQKWTMTSRGPLEIKINTETGRFLFYRGGDLVALVAALQVCESSLLRDIDVAEAKETLAQ